MPDPKDKIEVQVTEVGKKESLTGEEPSDLIVVKTPDLLVVDLPQLPYAPAFTNLIRFLNAVKDHLELIKEREVPLPRGNFLFILPPGEDIRRCIIQIAHQFGTKYVEVLTSRLLAENVISAQIVADALEKCHQEPHIWASLLFIPDFGDFVAGLQDPVQQYILKQVLGQNDLKDPPIILIGEVHDARQLPPAMRAQFDFIESVPPLSREEAVAILRETVKFELPWESPDLLCAPLWLNQLQKVGARINLMHLAGGSKQRKLDEKDVSRIIREITCLACLPEEPAEKAEGGHPTTKEGNVDGIFPKNVSFGEQILQDLASRQFSLASGVLDKFLQGTPINTLTEAERGLLTDYSILLSEDPAKLKVRLLSAKKRVDAIQNMFKKG
jgi:hypothetical protein